MKKKIVIAAIFVALILALLLVTADFNTYSVASKTIPCEEDGIIFSIVTYDGKTESQPFLPCLGHSWVAIDNQTDHPITLIDYEIQPNEIITIGVWAVTDHWGAFFNLEPAFMRQYGRYDGMISLSTNIDEAKMQTIETYIKEHDTWTFTRNCSCWASLLWNEVVPEEFQMKRQTILYTPGRIQKSFGEMTNLEVNKDFARAKGCFFYLNGVRTELRLCD